MKLLNKKILNRKIIIAFLIVFIFFYAIIPSYSYGWDLGGVLFKPLVSLVVTIIDVINAILGIFLGGFNEPLENMTNITGALASVENIFCNKYPVLNANIFSATTPTGQWASMWQNITQGSGASIIGYLKQGVASIYYILRNTGAFVLLCLLIYTGIRIVLSSSMPQEQQKWKMYLIDWLKALGLLVFIHLIMIVIFSITDLLANALSQALNNEKTFTQSIRDMAGDSWDFVPMLAAAIMYGYVTYLTVVFAFAYFKRVIWTAILIVIAPIVAVLYAIGGPGKEIYKRWFREFTVNCLIQPFHVVVFYILIMLPLRVSTGATAGGEDPLKYSIDIAGNTFTLVYSLIAMSMIRPAEKFIRQLFGMNGSIANTASFESGKMTMDATARLIKDLALTIGAAVGTGGASLAVKAATTGASAAGAGATGATNLVSTVVTAAEKGAGGATNLVSTAATVAEKGAGGASQSTGEQATEDENDSTSTQDPSIMPKVDSKALMRGRTGRFMDRHFGKDSRLAATGRSLFSSEGIDNMMRIRGDLHGFQDSLSFGVTPPDPGWQHGFMGEHIMEKNKRNLDANINKVANNKDNIQYVIGKKNLQTKWEKIYKDANGYVNKEKAKEKAEEEAKSILKGWAQQYVPQGITDVQSMYELYSFGKDNNISGARDIISSYNKSNKNARKDEKIMDRRYNSIKEEIDAEVEIHTEYKMMGSDGKELTINKNNKDSEEVKKAIQDRVPLVDGKRSIKVNLEQLNRQMELKVELEKDHIKTDNPENIKNLDLVVEKFRKMDEDKRKERIENSGELRPIIEKEIKRREEKEKEKSQNQQ